MTLLKSVDIAGSLSVGDKITAVGWPMLGTINDGNTWQVYNIGKTIYWFRRGKKKIGHYIDEFHCWCNKDNNNRFVKIVKS